MIVQNIFISRANDTGIILNEENMIINACSLEDFVNLIQWYGKVLNKVLEKLHKQ